jgi:hypothetical protein
LQGIIGLNKAITMNKEAKEQYMETLRERYLQGSKKEKGMLLNEYCQNTGMDRKYAIKKLRYKVKTKKKEEWKPRKEYYDSYVKAALVTMWDIFDRPCGQRLAPLLATETERLRLLGEVSCSDITAEKIRRMPSVTIDRKLKHEKEQRLRERKYTSKRSPLLCHKVPIKTSGEFDRKRVGQIQVDFVEHCGSSASGDYINSLSAVDIYSGWWEGEAVMGKGQERALIGLQNARERMPVDWVEFHPDNGSNLLNYHVFAYAEKERLVFSRSRPYKKNDNCFVEQKNSTHIRQVVGYLRYDTEEELECLNELYRNEVRLYKNFFQPVLKLVDKTRINGRIHKKYDKAKTPYHRLMESDQIPKKKKRELTLLYEQLNPAQLKREIDRKLATLYVRYQMKNKSQNVAITKKLTPSMVSYYMMQSV